MADIQNKQNVKITNSSGVTVGSIENIVNADKLHVTDENEISRVFLVLMEKADALVNVFDKQEAQNAIFALEGEAKKSDQADEKRVKKWLYFLAETAPDIGEVAIDTFLNPIKGLSTVFRKVAECAKAERVKSEKQA